MYSPRIHCREQRIGIVVQGRSMSKRRRKPPSPKRSWTPSPWGRLLTFSSDWSISTDGKSLTVDLDRRSHTVELTDVLSISQDQGIAWASVQLELRTQSVKVDGLPNEVAVEMEQVICEEIEESLGKQIQRLSVPAQGWAEELGSKLHGDRWITREEVEEILGNARRQRVIGPQLDRLLQHPRVENAFKRVPHGTLKALHLATEGLPDEVARRNEAFLINEVTKHKPLFEKIESKPLTPEQAQAVVCFENRLLLVAAAGSGKTSTLVAKAGYALSRGLMPGDQILMLAFNAAAAEELRDRIRARLTAVEINSDEITAKTFHSLGLSIIGHATGRKPSLAPWLDKANGAEEIESIIEDLCARSIKFNAMWQLYQFVYSDDVRRFGKKEEPEDWDRESGARGFRTRNGEIVKSREERTIADWLHFNGVRYVYEGKYEHDTADASHRQYQPDFYYPDAELYHEHFALDEDGNAPAHFGDYLGGVRWKRALHEGKGTKLFETTSAQLRDGSAIEALARELVARGIELRPDPNRAVGGRPIPPIWELVRPFRTFQTHAKSNRLSMSELRKRLLNLSNIGLLGRHKLFLDLYEQISEEWDRRLVAGNYVDFEDMLNLATDHIETGRWKSPYRLVLADEFQDASQSRARFLQALVREPGHFLCAVGDDWQSINRFAGADVGVMTGFEKLFGKGETKFLSTSFRCPKSLCDLSSAFVGRNPSQIPKTVTATRERAAAATVCYSVDDVYGLEPLIEKHLRQLWQRVKSGAVEAGPSGSVSVFILGRYRRNRPASLEEWKQRYSPQLRIEYFTVHGSKGLEADYVCVVGLTRGRYGFPSEVEDDPILPLAMPTVEEFPFAEERRLFYVALTRARRLVMLYTVENQISEFLVELQSAPYKVEVRRDDAKKSASVCPACSRGALVRREGRYGAFWGCSRFPACDYTAKLVPSGMVDERTQRPGDESALS
ncbi:MAG: UvrD-helicase domain-containing protein [Betaproteobacteria bacterium]